MTKEHIILYSVEYYVYLLARVWSLILVVLGRQRLVKRDEKKPVFWERKGKSSTGSEISELQNLNVLETRSSVAFTDEHANLLKFCDLKVKSAESTPHKFRVCCFYRCYFSIFFYVWTESQWTHFCTLSI